MKKRLLAITLLLSVTLLSGCGCSNSATPVNEPASPTSTGASSNSVWAKDYTDIAKFNYYLDGDDLYIKRYKGGAGRKIRVAPAYQIDGKTYHVVSFEDATFIFGKVDSVIIPNGTRHLDAPTFNSCGVKFVYLPNTLESVEDYFWSYFHNVEKLYYGGTQEEWNNLFHIERGKLDVKEIVFNANPDELN